MCLSMTDPLNDQPRNNKGPGSKPTGLGDRVRLVPVHDQLSFNLAEAIARQTEQQALNDFAVPLKPLLGFEGVIRNGFQRGILFSFEDYLELVDCTGRISRSDKRGAIDESALPILERLNLDPERWCHRATAFEDGYQDYRNPGRRRRAA